MENEPAQPAQAQAASHQTSATLSCVQCRNRKVRCDRQRPVCGRCAGQSQKCDYPSTRHHAVGRRKTVRELEERIGQFNPIIASIDEFSEASFPRLTIIVSEQLEGLLRATTLGSTQPISEDQSESASGVSLAAQPDIHRYDDPNSLGIDFPETGALEYEAQPSYQDLSFNDFLPSFGGPPSSEPALSPDNQLIGMGLFETLPSLALVNELTALFFQNVAAGAPMLHQANYMMSLGLPQHMSPPLCLQYIVLASGAATSPAHRHLADAFYQRSRIYAESDELKGSGLTFATVGHVQSWLLISAYECHVHAVFTRASTSFCRALRIAQMINLHRLDSQNADILLSSLPPARNFIEAEERRRTWWVVVLADRFLAATTGWPSLVDERLIHTNLPSSDEAFAAGNEPLRAWSLADGLNELRKGHLSQLPFLSVRILAANELLHALEHTLHQLPGGDLSNRRQHAAYWQRHAEIDGNLEVLDVYMRENMQLTQGSIRLDSIIVHACTHMAHLQLHRIVVGLAAHHSLPNDFVVQSQTRLQSAAHATLEMFRAAGDGVGTAIRNPVLSFAAYMAALVFLENSQEADASDHRKQESGEGMVFLAQILNFFSPKIPLVRTMASQLNADMRQAGYDPSILNESGVALEEASQMLKSSSKQLPMVFCPALTVAFSSQPDALAASM